MKMDLGNTGLKDLTILSILGVGVVIIASFLGEIGSPLRFEHPRQNRTKECKCRDPMKHDWVSFSIVSVNKYWMWIIWATLLVANMIHNL